MVIYDIEIVIGNDFSIVRISTIRIFRSDLKAFTKISVTSIHIRAIVVFNHVVKRRRCRSTAGIRSPDIGTARNIVEVDASQRRNACRFDHNLIRFQEPFITGSCIGIGFVSLDDIILESAGVPFIFFIFNGIAITDPIRFAGNRFFVIAVSIKSSCITVCHLAAPNCVIVVARIHKHCHILAFYCRTCIRRIRRSHSAS